MFEVKVDYKIFDMFEKQAYVRYGKTLKKSCDVIPNTPPWHYISADECNKNQIYRQQVEDEIMLTL